MKRRLCDRFATLRLGRAEARAEMVAGWAGRGGWAGARSVRRVWGGRGAGPASRGPRCRAASLRISSAVSSRAVATPPVGDRRAWTSAGACRRPGAVRRAGLRASAHHPHSRCPDHSLRRRRVGRGPRCGGGRRCHLPGVGPHPADRPLPGANPRPPGTCIPISATTTPSGSPAARPGAPGKYAWSNATTSRTSSRGPPSWWCNTRFPATSSTCSQTEPARRRR